MATGISACQRVDDLDDVLSGVGEAQVRIEQHETDSTEASHFEEGDTQGTATQRREGDHANAGRLSVRVINRQPRPITVARVTLRITTLPKKGPSRLHPSRYCRFPALEASGESQPTAAAGPL